MKTSTTRRTWAPIRHGLLFAVLVIGATGAQAGAIVNTYVQASQSAVEQVGFDLVPWNWAPEEVSEKLIDQTTRLDTQLTFPFPGIPGKLATDQQSQASGQYVRGLGLGGPLTGPVLKADTSWSFSVDGDLSADGATWDRIGARQVAEVQASFNLAPLAGAATASTLIFWWNVTGLVDHRLFAEPLGGLNPFPFVDPLQFESLISFGGAAGTDWRAGQVDLPRVGWDGSRLDAASGWYDNQVPFTLLMPVAVDAAALATGPVSFGLSIESNFLLANGDFANESLEGDLLSRFGQSAELLGVTPLDALGQVVAGYGLTADDGMGTPFALQMLGATPAPAIPEPGTWALLLAGLAAMHWTARRRLPAPRPGSR